VRVPYTVRADGADVLGSLTGLFGGDLPTLVFDATGNINSMQKAFE
jgi:hypothetical protein